MKYQIIEFRHVNNIFFSIQIFKSNKMLNYFRAQIDEKQRRIDDVSVADDIRKLSVGKESQRP